MSIEALFGDFDRLMQSPASVHRLRRFILDLAVRGKLVPQDPADEPAAALLQRIAKEKARLVKAGEIKKNRAKSVCMTEAPFELPRSWKWTALGNLFLYDAGTKREPATLDRDWWLLELEDVEKETGRLLARIKASGRESKSTKSEFRVGDILYGKLRPYLNKVLVADEPGYSTTEIVALRPYLPICSQYCALALRRPDFVAYVTRLGQGTKMPRLRTEDAAVAPFPLPPIAEQHRIVAKVGELMGLCDRLEAAQTERETTRTHLTAASLARLSASEPDEAKFREQAAFALDNFTPLTTRPEQVKELRRTILNLAVRGKLVPQDPGDDTVTTLLKRQKIAIPSGEAFKVPTSWAWVNVGMVAKARLGKMLDKAKNKGTLRKYLRNINVRWLDFDLTDLLEMRFEDSELQEFSLQSGDVMVCEGGEPGRAAVWDGRESDIYFQKAIHRIRFLDIVAGEYFVRALQASADDGRLVEYFTGTGIKHFTGKALNSYIFPLPPLAEQRRIVTKVDKLMGLCDKLEGSLEVGGGAQGQLFDTLLYDTFKLETMFFPKGSSNVKN